MCKTAIIQEIRYISTENENYGTSYGTFYPSLKRLTVLFRTLINKEFKMNTAIK